MYNMMTSSPETECYRTGISCPDINNFDNVTIKSDGAFAVKPMFSSALEENSEILVGTQLF